MADQRRLAALSPEELDQALRDLGRQLFVPPTPDIASSIRARIASQPPRRAPIQWPSHGSPWRGLAAAVLALIVVGAVSLALFPDFRDAVADRLGVRGIRIVVERATPTPESTTTAPDAATPAATASSVAPATPVGVGLLLGRPTTIEDARARVPFPIQAPALTMLGPPDEVYLRTLADGVMMITLLYQPGPGLPETEETGVGAVLMQFRGGDDIDYLAKGLYEEDTQPRQVVVNGEHGWWVTGSSRLLILPDPSEVGCCGLESRSSGNVLLWVQDGVTFRLETALALDAALALAETLAVYPPPPATPGTAAP